MARAIPVIDLDAAEARDTSQLAAVRAATEDLGVVQVVGTAYRRLSSGT